jgi:serine/threonine protein kinase
MQLVGARLGRYHLLKQIGSGGMGDVYLAEDPDTDRQVALKVIRLEMLLSPDPDRAQEAIRLFRREAKAIAKFNHPYILPIYDYGEQSVNGTKVLFIIMPLYQDGSLADWFKQRNFQPLTPEEVAPFLNQAADALQYAHDLRIIHRDVKPANFLLRNRKGSSFPDLLLADFGNAAIMNATISPEIRGTPQYMAPEQWENRSVPATDQYALAIMAYQLLTGRTPFSGQQLLEFMQKHLNEEPLPPSTLNSRLTKEIDSVILRALEKNPDDRFDDIVKFAEAFQDTVKNVNDLSTATLYNRNSNKLLKPPTLIKLSILVASTLGLFLYLLNLFLAIPAIPYVGLGLIIIAWVLGLIHSSWFRQWNWFFIILLLSPFAGIVYGIAGPTRKPQSIRVSPIVKALRDKTTKTRQIIFWVVGITLVVEIIGINSYTNYASNRAYYDAIAPGRDNAYAMLTHGSPSQYYPLTSNIGESKWEERNGCTFTAQAYHISSSSSNNFNSCFLQGMTFKDFVFQAQMTIIGGGTGGLLFRDSGDNANGFFYCFRISKDGSWELRFYLDKLSNNFNVLGSGQANAFQTDLGKLNTIGIVAKGGMIDLYINQQYLDSFNDASSKQGSIALLADDLYGPAEVVYNKAEIWVL